MRQAKLYAPKPVLCQSQTILDWSGFRLGQPCRRTDQRYGKRIENGSRLSHHQACHTRTPLVECTLLVHQACCVRLRSKLMGESKSDQRHQASGEVIGVADNAVLTRSRVSCGGCTASMAQGGCVSTFALCATSSAAR